ncbi:lck-interacting transmembrane adapter 1 isoform X2 [Chionomys nivalis]|uniref:lck-interacting transmembrane adapter 1 isoform X2 n=1 Tax=Chionomys nivalis TaxID=269649 RepID=UPI002593B1B8|nr:lck-interacting transmembrane adapter 1 isoform X2 [Chionomys nivalis]
MRWSSPAAHRDLPGCPRQDQAATPRWPWSPFPALEDEAISAFSPTSPLGLGVLLPAPLAVGTVHSLPQVCAWGCVCPLHVWLCMCVYTGPGPGPSSAHWTNGTLAPRKRAQRQQTGLQGSLIPVEMSLLRQAHVRSLSKSDTRLHELRPGLRCSIAPRPASMDLLHPHWLEVSRGSTRSQVTPSAFPPRQLPRAPPAAPATSPEATYSNVRLAAIPRASLAASPVVWAGTQLTISCAKLGPGAEYACIQKRKETEQGYHELQEKAKVLPATQMDLLYSRVCKPKRRDPRPGTDQPDPQGGRGIVAPGGDVEYEAITLRGQDMNQDPLENVYESIREMGP